MELAEMTLYHWLVMATVGLVAAWFFKLMMTRPKNLPPGPTGIPLLGVASKFIGSDPLALLSVWADRYGEITSFRFGPKLVVLLNSYEVVAEAFRHPDLQNRPRSLMMEEVSGTGHSGLLLGDGESWKEQRKFVYSVFRSLGVGKKSYEDTVAAEMAQLGTVIAEKQGSPFDPSILFEQAVANVICSIIFGTQYKYSDTDFQHILHLLNTNMKGSGGGGWIFLLPIPGISKFPFGIIKTLVSNAKEFNGFINGQIEAHKKNLDPEVPKDFIDQYLIKLKEMEIEGDLQKMFPEHAEGIIEGKRERGRQRITWFDNINQWTGPCYAEGTDSSFNQLNLKSVIGDLFFAGTETTTTTLKWCILYMMANPDVQSRVQDELDHVVGRDRLPGLQDRKNLPYTNAVMMETQRKGAVVALGVPHVAANDVTLRGYMIPKDTIIFPNIWKVLNSKDSWDDADGYNPERFLNEDGMLIKRDELIFFSTGRRICIGEQLARMETFLGFTSLLHRFTFKKPDNSSPLSLKATLGGTRDSLPYLTCAIPR